MLSPDDGRDAVVDLLLEDKHFANLDADYQRSRRVETFNANFRAHHQLRHLLPEDSDPEVVTNLIYYFFHFMCKISRGQLTTLRVRRVLNLLKRTVRRVMWLHERRKQLITGIVEMWKREEEVMRERVNQLAQRNQVEQAKMQAHVIAQSCFPDDVKRVIITDMYFEKNRKFGAVFLGWLRRLQIIKQKVTHADRDYKRLIMHGHEMHFSMVLTHASSVLMSAKAEQTKIEQERPTWTFTQHSVTMSSILEYVEEWSNKSVLMQAPLSGGFLDVNSRVIPTTPRSPRSPKSPRSPRLHVVPLESFCRGNKMQTSPTFPVSSPRSLSLSLPPTLPTNASNVPRRPLTAIKDAVSLQPNSASSPHGSLSIPQTFPTNASAAPRRPLGSVKDATAQPSGVARARSASWLESSPASSPVLDAAPNFSPRNASINSRRFPSMPDDIRSTLALNHLSRKLSSLDSLDCMGRPHTPVTPTISLSADETTVPTTMGLSASPGSMRVAKLSPLKLSGPIPSIKSPRSSTGSKGGLKELSAIPPRMMHSSMVHREPASI